MAKAVKAVVSIAFSAVKTLGGACWSAVSTLGPTMTKAWDWVKGIAGVVSDVWTKVKGWVQPLWDFYKDYVQPVLEFIHNAISVVQNIILVIQGRLDELWKKVTDELIGPVKTIIKDIEGLWRKIEDVVAVFNKELADKMAGYDSYLSTKLNALVDNLYDKTIGEVKSLLDPLRLKINEIDALFHQTVGPIMEALNKLGALLDITFEKPGVLKSEVLKETSMHWGMQLWNDLFSGVTPVQPITPSKERMELEVDPVVDEHIRIIFAEQAGAWKDIDSRVDEEIREVYYGEIIPEKTRITYPKLSKGAGGGY